MGGVRGTEVDAFFLVGSIQVNTGPQVDSESTCRQNELSQVFKSIHCPHCGTGPCAGLARQDGSGLHSAWQLMGRKLTDCFQSVDRRSSHVSGEIAALADLGSASLRSGVVAVGGTHGVYPDDQSVFDLRGHTDA
jgi:hypothetical protein